MPQIIKKVANPERVVLTDGRKGYFINMPMDREVELIVKYPSAPSRKRNTGKPTLVKKTKLSTTSKSVVKALKEVKSRKTTGRYPKKDFDALMDEL